MKFATGGHVEPGTTPLLTRGCDYVIPKPRPKRTYGDAPAAVYSDHYSRKWTWECRITGCTIVAPQEGVAWHDDHAGAMEALAEHQRAVHTDALFHGDRGGMVGQWKDRASERSRA